MTAVIGILNKSGIALAADSAVTISRGKGRKIYNSAYKIITLSKYHPVGIMIYSSASFMGIPWEVLIKEYRRKLGRKSFETLDEYRRDFINYLKGSIDLVSEKVRDGNSKSFIKFIFKRIIEGVTNDNLVLIEKAKSNKKKQEILSLKLKDKIRNLMSDYESTIRLEDFKDYEFEDFKKAHLKSLSESSSVYFGKLNLSRLWISRLYKIAHSIIVTNEFLGAWTGLVFAGYGDKEIYPGCLHTQIGEAVDGRIRYFCKRHNGEVISDENGGSILPFAQRDVIDTILSGIDQNLQNAIFKSFDTFLIKFIDIINSKIGDDNKELKEKVASIDVNKLMKDFSNNFSNVQMESHIRPLMTSISSLSKEDLAELAESLIYLTYLKRRMSFSEESVGGPIDVAIITKGDGFVWIKRKHYFSIELNQHFSHKYYE